MQEKGHKKLDPSNMHEFDDYEDLKIEDNQKKKNEENKPKDKRKNRSTIT